MMLLNKLIVQVNKAVRNRASSINVLYTKTTYNLLRCLVEAGFLENISIKKYFEPRRKNPNFERILVTFKYNSVGTMSFKRIVLLPSKYRVFLSSSVEDKLDYSALPRTGVLLLHMQKKFISIPCTKSLRPKDLVYSGHAFGIVYV
jgi:ribosomal protein S8